MLRVKDPLRDTMDKAMHALVAMTVESRRQRWLAARHGWDEPRRGAQSELHDVLPARLASAPTCSRMMRGRVRMRSAVMAGMKHTQHV